MILKRLIGVGLILALPYGVYADDSSAAALQPTDQSTASPQTSALLQPAGGSVTSPLQSADASSGGLSQSSTSQNLQQTGDSGQAKLLIQGEADAPHQADNAPDLSWLWYLLAICGIATAFTAALWLSRRRTA